MIINRFPDCFVVEMQRPDWFLRSTYTLIELLKSIPKGYRRFDWNTKQWIVNNKYESILEQVQVFTKEEERIGEIQLNEFISLFFT